LDLVTVVTTDDADPAGGVEDLHDTLHR
jgi:hypothetical protein